MNTHYIVSYQPFHYSNTPSFLTARPAYSSDLRNDARQFATLADAVKGYAERTPFLRNDDRNLVFIRVEETLPTEVRTVLGETEVSNTTVKYAAEFSHGFGTRTFIAKPATAPLAKTLDGAQLFDTHGQLLSAIGTRNTNFGGVTFSGYRIVRVAVSKKPGVRTETIVK